MKISVITATIEGGEALRRTLDSVRQQTGVDIEHVVVDGTDGPDVAATAADFEGVRVVRRARAGVYDALNCGIDNTRGDIVGLLHADDTLADADTLARVARAFADDPDLDFVYGDIRYVSHRTHAPRRIYHADSFRPEQLRCGIYPPHPTLYIRRSTVCRLGPYSVDYVNCGDYDMWIRLFAARPALKWRYLPGVMVNMPVGGMSTRYKSYIYTNNIEKLRVLRSHGLPANPLRLMAKHLSVARRFLNDLFHGK